MPNYYPYQVKSAQTEIKNVDVKARIVEGYFSAFGMKDSDGDIIRRGAYEKTIRESGPDGKNRIMHLLQHNPMKPLGKPEMLEEDNYGLKFRTKISDTSYGTDVLKLYRDEVFNEHSVGFNVIRSEQSQEENANVITEIKLWEGSTVTWGANENTPVTGMKGLEDSDLLDRYNELSKAFYNGDYTDDTFKMIERQKEHIEGLIRKHISAPAPSDDTQAADIKDAFDSFNTKLKIEEHLHV